MAEKMRSEDNEFMKDHAENKEVCVACFLFCVSAQLLFTS